VTLASHTHVVEQTTTAGPTTTVAYIKTSAGASATTSSSYVTFTGGAAKVGNAGAALAVLGGALGAVMVAL
jgi:hypothetical protein